MNNIILIWMPWSGKTTIWKPLAEKRWMKIIDFDDDIIEPQMWKSVAKVLKQLWEEEFLNLEEKLSCELSLENTILSTSGSVPLKEKAIEYLKTQWKIIYINIPLSTIKTRLESMKVDRIVWMKNMSMNEILEYRQSFYEKSYDYKFDTDWLKSRQEVFEEFWEWFQTLKLA